MRKAFLNLMLALLGAVSLFAGPRPAPDPRTRYEAKVDAFLGDPGSGGPTTKSILYGGSAILWPNFSNGTAVINNGVGTVTSGVSYPVSPTTNTTYTLTVTNAAGDFVSSQVTVDVATVSMSAVSPATKTLSVSHSFGFGGAAVSGAVDTTKTWSVDGVAGGNATVGTIDASGNYTAPATPGTYTIRATSNALGTVYQEAVVTVVAMPSFDVAFAATPTAISYGGTSALTATWSNATSATLVGGVTNEAVTSPLNFTTPALTADTTYTLTLTNAAGDTVQSQVTVTVTSVSMTDLSPTTKTLSLTKTFQVTGGAVSGAVDTSVTWSVVGGAANGTIDASGNYTAPAVMPGGGETATVTVRATSNANNAVFKEMTITLVKLPVINYFVVE